MQTTTQSHRISPSVYLALLPIGLVLLVVGKDLCHAQVRSYSFYLSESLLFSTFWVLFIPLLWGSRRWRGRAPAWLPLLLSMLHVSVFAGFVSLVSTLFFSDAFGFRTTVLNTATDEGLICLLLYGLFFLWGGRTPVAREKSPPRTAKISVSHRGRTVLLASEDIGYVRAEKPYIALVTAAGTYLLPSTLQQFLRDHGGGTSFVRIHRSTIVNTDHILAFRSRKNGDYDVELTGGHTVRASRSYRNNFAGLLASPDSGY